jgi:hypothetical protein
MEREEDRGNFHVSERVLGTFQRTLKLPFPVDPDRSRPVSTTASHPGAGGARSDQAGGSQSPEGGETQH